MSKLVWHKVLNQKDELQEGRVMTVWAGHQGICLTHYKGKFSALDNRCPHQGGPLGEGSIENGMLRCPWHGWEFDIKTGKSIFNPNKVRVACYDVEVEAAEEKAVESYEVGVNDEEMVVVYL